MRAATRPVIASVRTAGRRAASSSSSTPNPVQNEQVQKAVDQAQKMYSQGSAAVQKFAGPVGDRVGAALGCELGLFGQEAEHIVPSEF
jgi:F-type H+-transporting ATPase subunit g